MFKASFGNFFSDKQSISWRSLISDVVLAALLGGPVAAPFLVTLDIFPLEIISNIIYFMGGHVCPQPEMGLMISSPNLMAVCMRCYGLLLALLATRLLYLNNQGKAFYWLNQYRIKGAAIASILTCAYATELIAQVLNFWEYNNIIVTIFGYITGLGIGLFMMPILHNQKQHEQ